MEQKFNANVIELFIDDVDFNEYKVSIVDEPAIQVDFLKFKEQKMYFADEDKRIITGPAMIPDMKIFRLDSDNNPYYVWFSAETIEKIAHKFLLSDKLLSFNIDHSIDTNNIKMIESWIDRSGNALNMNLPKGTWFISAKVTDDKLWSEIKNGSFNGFSIEGMFGFSQDNDNNDDLVIREAEQFIEKYFLKK